MRRGMTLIELLVVLAIIGVLLGLLLPAVQKCRLAAARIQGANNLKQLALGCHLYEADRGRLPDNGNVARPGSTGYNWAFQILPGIERGDVYVSQPAGVPVALMLCPMRGRTGFATVEASGIACGPFTDYALNRRLSEGGYAEGDVNFRSVRLAQIAGANGTSRTILLGEKQMATADYANASSNGFWDGSIYQGDSGSSGRDEAGVYPDGVRLATQDAWGSPFPGGCPFALCDGSVRFVPYGCPAVGPALLWWGSGTTELP